MHPEMSGNRAELRLRSGEDVYALVELLRRMDDAFSIESLTGNRKVNAKSLLGVLYMMLEYLDGMYLVNETHAGLIPAGVSCFLAANA